MAPLLGVPSMARDPRECWGQVLAVLGAEPSRIDDRAQHTRLLQRLLGAAGCREVSEPFAHLLPLLGAPFPPRIPVVMRQPGRRCHLLHGEDQQVGDRRE